MNCRAAAETTFHIVSSDEDGLDGRGEEEKARHQTHTKGGR